MKGTRDEVVVGVRGIDVHLAEVEVAQVIERLESGREEDGADEGRADGRQQDRDAEGLGEQVPLMRISHIIKNS